MPSLHYYPTPLPGVTEKRWLGVGGQAFCQGAQKVQS